MFKKSLILAAAILAMPVTGSAQSVLTHGGPGSKGCRTVDGGQWCAVSGCLSITRVMYMSEDNVRGPGFANTRLDIRNTCNSAVDFAIRGKLNNEPVTLEPATVEANQTLRHPVPLVRPTNTNRVTATLQLIPYGSARDYDTTKVPDLQPAVATRRLTVTLEPIRQ